METWREWAEQQHSLAWFPPVSQRTQLAHKLAMYFQEDELKSMVFDLGADAGDVLAAKTKAEKVRDMITWFEQRGRLEELIEQCQQERPHVNWKDET